MPITTERAIDIVEELGKADSDEHWIWLAQHRIDYPELKDTLLQAGEALRRSLHGRSLLPGETKEAALKVTAYDSEDYKVTVSEG